MPGLHPTDKIYLKITKVNRDDGFTHKYEARVPVAIFGSGVGGNPFEERFRGTTISGKGYMLCVAIRKLKEEFDSLHESLWAEP